jgi:hypothetical protein
MSGIVEILIALIVAAATLLNTWLIRRLEKNTNSKMDKLVKVTGSSEHARGLKQGLATRRRRGGK